MGGVTLLVNRDGMMIVEKALCCVVKVEVFLRVLLGTMEEAMTLVVIGAAMLILTMAVMLSAPTTVSLIAIVEVLSGIVEIISVSSVSTLTGPTRGLGRC